MFECVSVEIMILKLQLRATGLSLACEQAHVGAEARAA